MGVWSLDQQDPLEEEMAIHSSILAWRMPWTEEPGSHDSRELAHTWHVCISTYKVPFHFIFTRTLEENLFTPAGLWDQMLLSETLSFSYQPRRNCPRLLVWVWILSGFWTDFSVRHSQGLYDRPVCGQETGVLQNAGSRQGLEGIFWGSVGAGWEDTNGVRPCE